MSNAQCWRSFCPPPFRDPHNLPLREVGHRVSTNRVRDSSVFFLARYSGVGGPGFTRRHAQNPQALVQSSADWAAGYPRGNLQFLSSSLSLEVLPYQCSGK